MFEVKIAPEKWEEANSWARANAEALGLIYEKFSTLFRLKKRVQATARPRKTYKYERIVASLEIALDFDTKTLGQIAFYWHPPGQSDVYALWYRGNALKPPPDNLEELIKTGMSRFLQPDLKKIADEYPAFSEAYDGIYRILFPSVGHHEIHRDISAWEEMLARDNALIRRLKE